jgi:2,3-bisphosphoglycerate-dependent phosphoglycerate mutase
MGETPDPPPQSYRQMRFTRPPGSTELLLVRHGESAPMVPGRPFPLVDGHGDPELAPEGRVQAEQVGARLANHPIDAIYVTTLRRTHETAAPLAARLGIEPVVEPDLREVHLGEWEGELYRKHMAEGHPIALELLKQQRWDVIPGAESAESIRTRVRGALDRIVAAHPGQCVVIVSHGGIIGEVLAQVAEAGRPFAFLGAANASISQVVSIGGRWILRRFNDTAHLAGDLDRDPDLDPVPSAPGT